MCRRIIWLWLLLTMALTGNAQKSFDQWLKPSDKLEIQPIVMAQFWGTYTFGQEIFDEELLSYQKVDNRSNIFLRRARLGFLIHAYDNLSVTVIGAFDQIGKDVLSGTVGSGNNGSIPEFDIWDAYIHWKISKQNQSLHLIGGYFRPQISRESITSAWAVNSMEKSMSQYYIRKHLTGKSAGRAPGINLGGLWINENQNFGINYNLGVFNPIDSDKTINSGNAEFAPLWVARTVLFFGDPEMTKYKISYDINYYSQRNGLSLGIGGAYQGSTHLFASSYFTEVDILWNLGPLNLDGEWALMWRQSNDLENETQINSANYFSNTGHFRIGYNWVIGKVFLEPSFMVMKFNGALDQSDQMLAKSIGSFSGREISYDIGVNWYLNKKRLKLMLHYIWREGNAGDWGEGTTTNQFFNQSDVGAIRRGDWLGIGMNMII